MGINRDEGSLLSGYMFVKPHLIEDLMNNFDDIGPVSMMLYEDEEPVDTANKLYDFYLDGHEITHEKYDNLTQLYTHLWFGMPLDWAIQLMAHQDPVYMYEFHYWGPHGPMMIYKAMGLNITEAEHSVCHGD